MPQCILDKSEVIEHNKKSPQFYDIRWSITVLARARHCLQAKANEFPLHTSTENLVTTSALLPNLLVLWRGLFLSVFNQNLISLLHLFRACCMPIPLINSLWSSFTRGSLGWRGVTLVARGGSSHSPGAVDADYSLSPPETVCAWWRATSYEWWPCCAEHSGSKGVYLEKQSPIYGVSVVPKGWMSVSESVFNGTLWDTGRPPSCI